MASNGNSNKIEIDTIAPHSNSKNDYVQLLLKETNRHQRYKDKFNALSKENKDANIKKAVLYHQKGLNILQNNDSKLAQRYFEKAIYLNPFNSDFNYELAVCAYRNGDHLRSLVLLDLLSGSNIDSDEITYYEALNNMKLNDVDVAIKTFGYVIDSNNSSLSPSAAMYQGLLYKQKNQLEEAKNSFQYVLDKTNDANLDKKAEQQIEDILSLQKFEEDAKKKFSYSLYSGVLYDSNVLNITQNNSALDLEAYRVLYGGSFEYRAIHKQKHTWTPRLLASDIYSFDKSLQSNSTVQSVDPLQFEVALPYSYNFLLLNTSSTIIISPAYSQIYMNLDQSGRKRVYSTTSLGSQLTTSFKETWVNSLRFDYSNDIFHPETAAIDDQSANKYNFTIGNTKFFDSKGTKSLNLDLSYMRNDAEGDNAFYNRLLVTVGGTFPIHTHWISYGKMDYLKQDFNKNEASRLDNIYILTAGGIYNINSKFNLNIYGQYQENQSNVAFFDFNKFSIMTMISYTSGSF